MLKNHPLSHLSMTHYPIMATSRFEGLTEDQLVRDLCKGKKGKKDENDRTYDSKSELSIQPIQLQQFANEMTILEKQIITMCKIAEQLLTMSS